MLKLQKVSKTFNQGTVNEKKVLHEINLELNEGDFVTIIGGNGAGKSTLLNIISLMDNSFEGEYIFLNKNVKELSTKEKEEYFQEKSKRERNYRKEMGITREYGTPF